MAINFSESFREVLFRVSKLFIILLRANLVFVGKDM